MFSGLHLQGLSISIGGVSRSRLITITTLGMCLITTSWLYRSSKTKTKESLMFESVNSTLLGCCVTVMPENCRTYWKNLNFYSFTKCISSRIFNDSEGIPRTYGSPGYISVCDLVKERVQRFSSFGEFCSCLSALRTFFFLSLKNIWPILTQLLNVCDQIAKSWSRPGIAANWESEGAPLCKLFLRRGWQAQTLKTICSTML